MRENAQFLSTSVCGFPQTTYEVFLNSFINPPTLAEKKEAQAEKSGSHTPTAQQVASKSRWKTVDATPSVFNPAQAIKDEDIDGVPMDEDIDGAPMDEDIDGAPMDDDDDDVDGEPMVDDDDDVDGEPMPIDEDDDGYVPPEPESEPEAEPTPAPESAPAPTENSTQNNEPEQPEEKKPTLGIGFGGMTGFKMGGGSGGPGPKRKRPKAEDMFADDYD